ncbi:Potassium channel SKOR [Fusarium albosuccineum]|uniref:Potassium channel SKOR n=1 Tax=Fusarium albosuccineum TaxID=1237068 RepID=A0A8H4LFI3_9HYPO|nr:Potassium channel SKOR [Fusarium albosuccineum]
MQDDFSNGYRRSGPVAPSSSSVARDLIVNNITPILTKKHQNKNSTRSRAKTNPARYEFHFHAQWCYDKNNNELWPKEYHPVNPACPRLRGGLNKFYSEANEKGMSRQALWEPGSDDGFLYKATKEDGKGGGGARVRQRTPQRAMELMRAAEADQTGTNIHQAVKPLEIKTPPGTSHDEGPNLHPTRYELPITISSGSESGDASASAKDEDMKVTIRRLEENEMLSSKDIAMCLTTLDWNKTKWHVFDPGFPNVPKPRRLVRPKAPHLAFFCHGNIHWSFCHLNTSEAKLYHYNSRTATAMPTQKIVDWAIEQTVIAYKVLDTHTRAIDIEVQTEICPQQGDNDNVNCGIYALAVFKALVAGEDVPLTLDPGELRRYFAERLKQNTDDKMTDVSVASPQPCDDQNDETAANKSDAMLIDSYAESLSMVPDSTKDSQSSADSRLAAASTLSRPHIDQIPSAGSDGVSSRSQVPELMTNSQIDKLAEEALLGLQSFMDTGQRKMVALQREQEALRTDLENTRKQLENGHEKLEQHSRQVDELEARIGDSATLYDFESNLRKCIGDNNENTASQSLFSKWHKRLTLVIDEMAVETKSLVNERQVARKNYEDSQEGIQCLQNEKNDLERRIGQLRDDMTALAKKFTKIREAAGSKVGGADFRQCRDARNHHRLSFHHSDTTLGSPIHLAARLGLDGIVSFLVDQGIDLDGPASMGKTPLAEAILHDRESTAILLVHKGASIGLQPPRFDAYRAAVCQGLAELTKVIAKIKGIDVNSTLGYGCTALTLAVCHRRARVLRTLLDLGADGRGPLKQFCQDHTFSSLLWALEAGAVALRQSVGIKGLVDLAVAVTTEQVSPIQKSQQVVALQTLLDLIRRERSAVFRGAVLPANELDYLLDALLQIILSVDRADVALASVLMQHGARMRVGIFLQLLGALNSVTFAKDTLRSLRRHPKLLQCFDLVYSHCVSLPDDEKGFAINYFMENVPQHALQLVDELKQRDLPLSARGVRMMDPIEEGRTV